MHFEYNYNNFDKNSELLNSARSLKFDDFDIINKLKKFFNDVLTSWDDLNSDLIVSNISIYNHEDTALFINELFKSLFELAMKSETTINANNIIAIINSLDTLLPEILISSSNGSYHALKEYEKVKERSFTACFNRVKLYLDEHSSRQLPSDNLFIEIKNVFLILTRISRIKYSELYVYEFASFLWEMFHIYYETNRRFLENLLFCLSSISDQLVKFLIWKNNEKNNQKFMLLALGIFSNLKNDLIHSKFLTSEIPYVLNILDHHDRFIGQFVDAVPENTFQNGYVRCSSFSQQSLVNDVNNSQFHYS